MTWYDEAYAFYLAMEDRRQADLFGTDLMFPELASEAGHHAGHQVMEGHGEDMELGRGTPVVG